MVIMCTCSARAMAFKREVENHRDAFTVVVVRSGVIVSHILMFLGPVVLLPAENKLVCVRMLTRLKLQHACQPV